MKSYLIWYLMHWTPNPSSHMSPCLDTFALYFYPVPWMPFCPFALHFSWQLEHPFWWLKLLGLCLWHDKCLHQRDQGLPEHSFCFRGFLWEHTWSLLIWRVDNGLNFISIIHERHQGISGLNDFIVQFLFAGYGCFMWCPIDSLTISWYMNSIICGIHTCCMRCCPLPFWLVHHL